MKRARLNDLYRFDLARCLNGHLTVSVMQNKIIISVLAMSAIGLSGCSQISSIFKGKSKTTTQVETTIPTSQGSYTIPDTVVTPSGSYSQTSSYGSVSSYAGYDVEFYNTSAYQNPQRFYYGSGEENRPAFSVSNTIDPRQAAFVKLNGESQTTDWQNCETLSQGYLYLSEYDLRLHPEFEVCMRNKGYVMTSELGSFSTEALTAQNSGLRGYAQPHLNSAGRFFP